MLLTYVWESLATAWYEFLVLKVKHFSYHMLSFTNTALVCLSYDGKKAHAKHAVIAPH